MSAYRIIIDGGHKAMVPIQTEQEYRTLRDTPRQQMLVKGVRSGNNPKLKTQLLQICYSCVPGPDRMLKGCKQPSQCVGMDIDFDPNDPDYQHKMETVPELVLSHREELGLLMLERSANKGYHLVFRRRYTDGLAEGRILENQEKNLRWASELLGVMYDEGAKDITRVFFSTTASPEDLLFFDPELLTQATTPLPTETDKATAVRSYMFRIGAAYCSADLG